MTLSAWIQMLRSYTDLVLVVLDESTASLTPTIYAGGASLVVNPAPELGPLSYLHASLREVLNQGRDAAMIATLDRPPAKATTILDLLEAFQSDAVRGQWAVVPEYRGTPGQPLLIGREMMEAFLRAPVNSSMNGIQAQHSGQITHVPVDDSLVTS